MLWAVGLVTALLTAFYMSRQVFMVFFGEERWRHGRRRRRAPRRRADARRGDDAAEAVAAHDAGARRRRPDHDDHPEPHESPWTMTLPLVVLAVLVVRRRAS